MTPTKQQSALHVVQVGYDDTVFRPAAPSDTRHRQMLYAAELSIKRPGSRWSVVMFTSDSTAKPVTDESVTCIPVTTGRGQWWRLYRTLVALHNSHPIDVIATQTIFKDAWTALAMAWPRHIPVIGQVHFDIFHPQAQSDVLGGRTRAAIIMRLAKPVSRGLSGFRVMAIRMQQQLHQWNPTIPTEVVPVLVSMMPIPENTIPDSKPRTVLFVGRLAPEKNLSLWLRVAAAVHRFLPDVRFVWAGDGPVREKHLAEVERNGLKDSFTWIGAVEYDRLPQLYQTASVFLLTSHYEATPRVLREASLHAIPAVTTDVLGANEIVVDGATGFIRHTTDETGLIDALVTLLRDTELQHKMGLAARKYVSDNFDPKRCVSLWVDQLITATTTSNE